MFHILNNSCFSEMFKTKKEIASETFRIFLNVPLKKFIFVKCKCFQNIVCEFKKLFTFLILFVIFLRYCNLQKQCLLFSKIVHDFKMVNVSKNIHQFVFF